MTDDGLTSRNTHSAVSGFVSRTSVQLNAIDANINTLVRDRRLFVEVADLDRSGLPVEYRVQHGNGGPLPAWLDQVGKNAVAGQCPPGVDQVRLRVVAIYADGTSKISEIEVDTTSGEVKVLPFERRSENVLPFIQQFKQRATLTPSDIEALADALP